MQEIRFYSLYALHLPHCDLVMPYGNIDLGQHWVRWLLAAWSTKPLPEPMLTNCQWGRLVTVTWGQFLRKCSISILVMSLKIINLRLPPHLPGANELISFTLTHQFPIPQICHQGSTRVILLPRQPNFAWNSRVGCGAFYRPWLFVYFSYTFLVSLALDKLWTEFQCTLRISGVGFTCKCAIWALFHNCETNFLTHCGLVVPYGGINLGQHWLRYWLPAWWHQAMT